MRRALSLTLAALAVLLAVATAQAKELSAFRACGAVGCRETRDPALLRRLIRSAELQGDPVSARTPAPTPFLRLEFIARSDDGTRAAWSQYYVPSLGRLAIETDPGRWSWVRAGALRSLRRGSPVWRSPAERRETRGPTPGSSACGHRRTTIRRIRTGNRSGS